MDEFLMPSELDDLARYVLAHEADFVSSQVVSPGAPGVGMVAHEYRRSRVLDSLGPYERLFIDRLEALLARVIEQLGVDPFVLTRTEVQITASNHGDFFREHSDTGQAEIATRALTFVYFFHPEPRSFRGGDLRLYDSRPVGNTWRREGVGQAIEPQQNQIIFFPSELVHEITPISCDSRAFADSRFTVNGWLHR
jgi:Rps23 Pro-64 3,4-dihydroxylase Tpa1-like proline 4-hydroxylase